jgi:hypothetical protein
MDLYAYAQIETLSELAKANGIEVPRLRGYRLMAQEPPITPEERKESEISAIRHLYEEACEYDVAFFLHPAWVEYSSRTDRTKKRFLTKDGELRWDLLHGKRRKNMKYLIKLLRRRMRADYDMWNKYAGKDGVLYIHTRCGGNNWEYYGCKALEKEPWYLDRVDDWFDGSYCSIYAKVQPPEAK